MNNQDQKRNLVSTLNREKVDTDFSNKSPSRYLSIHTIVQSLSLSLTTRQAALSVMAGKSRYYCCFFCALGPISLLKDMYETSRPAMALTPTYRIDKRSRTVTRPIKMPEICMLVLEQTAISAKFGKLTRRQELILFKQGQLLLRVRAVALLRPLEAVVHISLQIGVHAVVSWRRVFTLVVQIGRLA